MNNTLSSNEISAWIQAHVKARKSDSWGNLSGLEGFDQGFKLGFIAGIKANSQIFTTENICNFINETTITRSEIEEILGQTNEAE